MVIYFSSLFLFLTLCWNIKWIRFYLFSFFFVFLNENENIGSLLGINYVNDYELIVQRKDTHIYFPGIATKLIEFVLSIKLELDTETYKKFMRLQQNMGNRIHLKDHFLNLQGKVFTIEEFENYLSKTYLYEINSFLNILSEEEFIFFYENNNTVRKLLNGITNSNQNYYWNLCKNIYSLFKFYSILKRIPEEVRIFYIVPQLTMVNKITEMILYKNGDLRTLELHEFLISSSKFYTIIHQDEMYFVRRHIDKTNNYTNKGFGVKGHQCPAAMFVSNLFNKLIDIFKEYKIEIEGTVEYSTQKRFLKNIINKDDVLFKIS